MWMRGGGDERMLPFRCGREENSAAAASCTAFSSEASLRIYCRTVSGTDTGLLWTQCVYRGGVRRMTS